MFFEWLINKKNEKFYPITHAKAVLYDSNKTVAEEVAEVRKDVDSHTIEISTINSTLSKKPYYEVGTFTPTFSGLDSDSITTLGEYIKVGEIVHIYIYLGLSESLDISSSKITTLPFRASIGQGYGQLSVLIDNSDTYSGLVLYQEYNQDPNVDIGKIIGNKSGSNFKFYGTYWID